MIRFPRPEKLSEKRRIVHSRDDARVHRLPLPSDYPADAEAEAKAAAAGLPPPPHGKDHPDYSAAMEAFKKERDAYEAAGFDPSVIAAKPGMKVTVFAIAPFRPEVRGHLDTIEQSGQRIIESIAYGVISVEDGEWTDKDGNVIPFACGYKNGAAGQRLDEPTLAVLVTDDHLRFELWVHILTLNSGLHPEVRKSDSVA